MLKNHPNIFFILLLLLASCTVEPQPINYGKDACDFCRMNIVDTQHSAEFVTEKGKVYKFDAIECMLNRMKEFDETSIALFLIADHATPAQLTDATTATYLVSQAIPSPMGGFLSGFAMKEKANETQRESGGKLYDWEQIKTKNGL